MHHQCFIVPQSTAKRGKRAVRCYQIPTPKLILQELELKLERMAGSDAGTNPHNYIARSEHVRLLEVRLATQAAEAEGELQRKLNNAYKEAQCKVFPVS